MSIFHKKAHSQAGNFLGEHDSTSRRGTASSLDPITPPFSAVEEEDVQPTTEASVPTTAITPTSAATTAAPTEPQLEEKPKVGKPQVILRIRPTGDSGESIFEVDTEAKSIHIRVDEDKEDHRGISRKSHQGYVYFKADNILENSTQEEMFSTVAIEVIEKAMEGTPGMIVAVGPEGSGKTLSLFGLNGRYKHRGIVARTMEKMFEIRNRKLAEIDFRFGIGIVELRRDKIRDLLTLSPHEITEVGDRGPKGMYVEEVDCLEHGLGLTLRALIGQKLIHKDSFERYHTIVYLEILALSPLAADLIEFHSRITLVELASASIKQEIIRRNLEVAGCAAPSRPSQILKPMKPQKSKSPFPSRKCANPAFNEGPLAESIAVRRDIFALEQIFLKANEMSRMRRYLSRMEGLGLSMIASEKRKFTSGRNFRQNRLAHCLKDILDNSTEIRILLHIRAERSTLRPSMEAMRFAERAKLVPCDGDDDSGKGKMTRTEDQILQEVIQDVAPDLIHPSVVEKLNSEKMRVIQEQAVQYFESNIDTMKVCSKDKVKEMFENFRVLWNFLWELELNVSLRKAEAGMKQEIEKRAAGLSSMLVTAPGKSLSAAGHDDLNKEVTKKSSRRGRDRKDKKEKRRKDKHGRKDSKEVVIELDARTERTSVITEMPEPTEEDLLRRQTMKEVGLPEEYQESVPPTAEPPAARRSTLQSAITQSSVQTPPSAGDSPEDNPPIKDATGQEERTGSGGTNPEAPEVPADSGQRHSATLTSQPQVTIVDNQSSSGRDSLRKSGEVQPKVLNLGAKGLVSESMTTFSHVTRATQGVHHHKSFLNQGVFRDFKMYGTWGGYHQGPAAIPLSEEEIAQKAQKQEEDISNNFEEMKKVARRQAYHLLRAGLTKPRWSTPF